MKTLTVLSIRLALVLAMVCIVGTARAFTSLNDRFTTLANWDTSVAVDSGGITVSGNGVQIAATGADAFQRQDLKSVSSDYSWLGAGGPVTYLFNITSFPDPTNNNFEAHLMLVGNSSGGNYADFNEANVIYFKVFDYGDAYGAELYFKAGAPGSSIYNGRKAASFYGQSSPLGNWGFTLQGTNVAIFGPGSVTNTGTLLPSALTAFNQSALIYVGINPNGAANLGQAATVSRVRSFARRFTPLSDSFTDLANWDTSVAVNASGITLSGGGVDMAANGGDVFQRQDMKSRSGDFSWLNAGDAPATYTFTITNFPEAIYNNFEAHLLLVGNSDLGRNYADYNEANVIYFKVFDYGDAYGAELYFKAGAPSSSIYNGRKAASFYGQPSALGTWGFTLQGTNVAIFGPSANGTGTLLPTAVNAFDQSALIYVGINPNGDGNVGQAATIASVTASALGVTSAPPALTMERAIPGLEINANITGTSGTYQRQDMRTTNGLFSWITTFNPVTYQFTIAEFPDASRNSFEAHLLLVGNNPNPGQYGDYNEANVIYFRIADFGTSYGAELRYKLNKPLFSIYGPFATMDEGGMAASFYNATTPIGAWSVTFNSDTDVTISGPGGVTASGTLPLEVRNRFNASTHVYLGVNPNGDGNIGQGATFSSVAFTGFDTPLFIGSFSDNFMNLDNWTVAVAQDDTGIQLRPADTKLKIAWPSSADGFAFQSRSQFGAGSWADAGLPIYASTGRRAVFSNGAGNANFFRLAKP